MSNKLGNYFSEIFIDKENGRYSFTKFLAFGGHIFLCGFFVVGMIIMIKNKEIDHVLLAEIIGYILTLSGYKNKFGFNKTKNTQNMTMATEKDVI
jgi:hypothetical protein